MSIEAMELALEALESGVKTTADRISWTEYDCELMAQAITGIKEALAKPSQEPVAWGDLQKEAQQIVESKFLWKKFIDGTPLANDIACWMADFARQYTTPPQPKEPEQEPVAWPVEKQPDGSVIPVDPSEMTAEQLQRYTTPPQRKPRTDDGYHCVICGRFLLADEYGVILHDDIEHPPEMTFDDEEKPQ